MGEKTGQESPKRGRRGAKERSKGGEEGLRERFARRRSVKETLRDNVRLADPGSNKKRNMKSGEKSPDLVMQTDRRRGKRELERGCRAGRKRAEKRLHAIKRLICALSKMRLDMSIIMV